MIEKAREFSRRKSAEALREIPFNRVGGIP